MGYNQESYRLETIARKMIRSIGARRFVDPKMSDSFKVPFIDQLYDNLVLVVNNFPFDNG